MMRDYNRMNLQEILERIDFCEERRGISDNALSLQAGMSRDGIRNWRRRVQAGEEAAGANIYALSRIARELDVSELWLIHGIGETEDALRRARAPSKPIEDNMIDVYDIRASAGHGAVIESEEVIERLSFPPGYLDRITRTHPRHLKIIGVKGDSMEPTLKDDDVVMLDTTKTSLDFDGLFVLRWGDALHVKRVGRAGNGSVSIISDNKAIYPPIQMARADIQVIGKVIWMGKRA